LTLMRRIRQLPPNDGGAIPAIAVTGLASREDARSALTAGFQEHLPKPLQLDKLLETVARLGRPALGSSEKSEQREERRDHGV
jgi:CheY-like chemotaxis protein